MTPISDCLGALRRVPGSRHILLSIFLTVTMLCAPSTQANNIPFQGGPIMQTNTVNLIFWLPAGAQFDPSVTDGVGNYKSLIGQFFGNVSGTTYYSIAGQYAGTCSSIPCFVQNSLGAVNVGGVFVDTRSYAHANGSAAAGTQADPLLDADIQHEVQSIMTQKGWSDGTNVEYFVFTAANIQECFSSPSTGSMCTFFNPLDPSGGAYCAYHSAFTDSNGNNAVYAYMLDVLAAAGGCNEGITQAPNGQIASDREVALTTHEFFESVSDPLGNAWTDGGTEIGDNCNQQTGVLRANGSNVTLGNGFQFAVQEIWSNFTSSCSLGLASIQLAIATGNDDLRGDSSATTSVLSPNGTMVQGYTLKTQNQAGWANNSSNQQMFGFSAISPPQFNSISITLTSHDSGLETPDNWNIQSVSGEEVDAAGNVICTFGASGNPLSRLTQQVPTAIVATPSCGPPPPPAALSSLHIAISTGNDDARSDSEVTATLPGEAAICLKPSNNAEPDGTCANGSSATDQNGNQSWGNWSGSTQNFSLSSPATAAQLGTITITLVEHNSGFETDDNWDLQGISLTGFDSSGNATPLLNISNPRVSGNDNNCMARLKGAPSSVTYVLSAGNPTGSNLSNATFGATPPGSCPQ